MTIQFDCDCGMTLRVKDEKAGRTIHCPECDDKLVVPDDSGARTVEEDEPKARKVRVARIADDEPPRRRRRDEDDDEDDEDRPRPRKRKKRPKVEESSGLSAQFPIAIGCLMMLGAVVWLVVGLMAGWIFYYPPIMFVLGFISVCKGMMPK